VGDLLDLGKGLSQMTPKENTVRKDPEVIFEPSPAVRAILRDADGTVVATIENAWPEVVYRVIDFATREVDHGSGCSVEFEPIRET
jgi:hypothetical protein